MLRGNQKTQFMELAKSVAHSCNLLANQTWPRCRVAHLEDDEMNHCVSISDASICLVPNRPVTFAVDLP